MRRMSMTAVEKMGSTSSLAESAPRSPPRREASDDLARYTDTSKESPTQKGSAEVAPARKSSVEDVAARRQSGSTEPAVTRRGSGDDVAARRSSKEEDGSRRNSREGLPSTAAGTRDGDENG